MKRIILLAGLPGVGKSTISKNISQKIGAKILDIDDFKRIEVDPTLVTSQIDPPEVRWAYYKKALEHAFMLFAQGISTIIMDEIFHLQLLRAQLEVLCQEQGVEVLWIEVRCPYNIIERRLRAKKRDGHILSTEEALKMNLLFREIFQEFPTNSQNYILINNENESDIDIKLFC